MKSRTLGLLILDFLRPSELLTLLQSLRNNVHLEKSEYRITCLANGGDPDYQDTVYSYYQDGLIDDLIIHSENTGGGAMEQLFHYAREPYCIQLQSDQELIQPIDKDVLDYFIGLIDSGYKFVDLAGNQCNGQYSDRAGMFKTEFYRSLSPLPGHSPGPNFAHGLLNNEGFLQNKFKENDWKVVHIAPIFFQDNGKWSVREHACGGITKWRTDLKTLEIIKPLHQKYDYLNISDDDWDLILSGKWINGTIPKNWQKDSFNCFGD